MAQKTNSFKRFWKELKRRKVIRVIPVYAVAAFVIMQVVSMIIDPLHLPGWTMPLLIVLLVAGFIVAVILAWAYEITPSGVEKTKPVEKVIEKTNVTALNNNLSASGKSIAVLPFVDMSPEKDQDYFCDGITEEIINVLTHNDGLKVIARTSAFAFKNKQVDIREIGRILDVGSIVEGSIRKADNKLRITAQLIKVSDGSHIWSECYDREFKDVFGIQDEIAAAITDNLKAKLLDNKQVTTASQHTEKLEAYNLYLKGVYYSRTFTLDGFKNASECYEKAFEIDPDYALAYVGLAEVLAFQTFWGNVRPSEGLPIKGYIEKALSVNHELAEAFSILGGLYLFFFQNVKEAAQNYNKALQIKPNSSMILIDYAIFLSLTGKNEEAIRISQRAKEFDPLSWYINSRAGDVFAYAGEYDKAIEEYKSSVTINPDYFLTHFQLGLIYAAKKQIKKAFDEFKKADYISNGNPMVIATLITAYNRIGRKWKANKLFEILRKRAETEYVPPSCFFIIYATKGDEEKAMVWLRKACIEHDTFLPYTRLSILRNLTSTKYLDLLKEMGLDY